MNVLVFHDDSEICAWLCEENLDSVDDHITNGYPHLEALKLSGVLKAEIITAPEALFNKKEAAADSFEVSAGKVQQKVVAK